MSEIATVPFRFKGIHSCEAVVAMPITFSFVREMIACVENSLGIEAFDLYGIPGFPKKFLRQTLATTSTLSLACEKHLVKTIVIFQSVDIGESRFPTQQVEDEVHKMGMIKARKNIMASYPGVEVIMIYARLINNLSEIEFVEVDSSGKERIRLICSYRFKNIYTCETSLLSCLDFRFRRETRRLAIDYFNANALNLIGLPGGGKSLLDDDQAAVKAIEVAIKTGTKKIIVVHHQDCGAYGGSREHNSPQEEEKFHKDQLRGLRKKIQTIAPSLDVELVYARLVENETLIQFIKVV